MVTKFLLAGYTAHHHTVSIRSTLDIFQPGRRIFAYRLQGEKQGMLLSLEHHAHTIANSTVWRGNDKAAGFRSAFKPLKNIGAYWAMMSLAYEVLDNGDVIVLFPSPAFRAPPKTRSFKLAERKERLETKPITPPPPPPQNGDTITALVGDQLFELPANDALRTVVEWSKKGYCID